MLRWLENWLVRRAESFLEWHYERLEHTCYIGMKEWAVKTPLPKKKDGTVSFRRFEALDAVPTKYQE